MTFIASVVAKKGVAIIADSLVTSQSGILHYHNFLDYLANQPTNNNGDKIVDPDEIRKLFAYEPIFTKDFEEKLFKFNSYTAITTCGVAYIDGQSISDLVEIFINANTDEINDMAIPFMTKVNLFANYLTSNIKNHIAHQGFIGSGAFIITFYEKHTHKTHIVKININYSDNTSLNDPNYEFISIIEEHEIKTVVCEGQNKTSEKILYGAGRELYVNFEEIIGIVLDRLKLPAGMVPENFLSTVKEDPELNVIFFRDLELLNLNNLSLQQAVDLACLLMRLEVDIQKYTKNIPTVGGVIKLAIIDENGFKFLSGQNIEVPRHIKQ